jgi:hypothetical protein
MCPLSIRGNGYSALRHLGLLDNYDLHDAKLLLKERATNRHISFIHLGSIARHQRA